MSSPEQRLRIGLFGGSFDPIHNGHISIATKAAEQFQLDRVLFIPAAQSPLKKDTPSASDRNRINMIRLAIKPFSSFEISDIEIKRGGVSYSEETAEKVLQTNPGAKLFWIVGGDQVNQLDHWRNIEALARKVEFIYLKRGSGTKVPEIVSKLTKMHPLKMERIPISSTEIRRRVKTGDLPKYFLPDPVFHYINSRNLYRDEQTTT